MNKKLQDLLEESHSNQGFISDEDETEKTGALALLHLAAGSSLSKFVEDKWNPSALDSWLFDKF